MTTVPASSPDTTVHPFRVDIPDEVVDDLRRRLAHTRWPADSPVPGWRRGVPLSYIKELTRYWSETFDWREQEAALNQVPQFTTTVNGQQIHFLHVRSPQPDARPLIMTHGWPSSPVEFLKVIGPLSDPVGHGGEPSDAFHLVIPSLPGYGFSPAPTRPGWGNLFGVASAWAELVQRLGYERYGVHGTDVGAGVAGMLSMVDPERVVGVHVTGTVAAMPLGPALDVAALPAAERERGERFNAYRSDGIGYLHLQSTRPQTLAYLLNDSPAGQLAWIVEKFHEWTDPAAELPDQAVDRNQLLTNASILWFTDAGASSAHATYDGIQAWREMAAASRGDSKAGTQTGPPTGVAVFAADTGIRSVMDPHGDIEHWSEFNSGGHFPAMEVPDLLTADLRSFFCHHR